MPFLREVEITKAWRYASEPNRIHYILRLNTVRKHLYVDKDAKGGLYAQLDERLRSLGYVAPASADREKETA